MIFATPLIALALAGAAFGAPTDSKSSAVDTAKAFVTAYSNMDFDTLASLTTDDYTFSDAAYPKIQGDKARGMYKWFIHDKEKTQMKVTLEDVQPGDDDNTAIAKFTDDYYFNGNHVVNHITSTMQFQDGKLANEKDDYSFADWAEQALGPIVGPVAKDLDLTKKLIQVSAEVQLDMFLALNP